MLRYFALLSLVALVLGEWSFDKLNPFNWEKGVTPHRDYSTSMSEFDRLRTQLDDLFPTRISQRLTSMVPMDVRETNDFIDIQLDLPGVEKSDISITIYKNNEVVVTATKKGVTMKEDPAMKRVERYTGKLTRTIMFPNYVDLEQLAAKYSDGVLYLRTPKTGKEVEDVPRSIEIK